MATAAHPIVRVSGGDEERLETAGISLAVGWLSTSCVLGRDGRALRRSGDTKVPEEGLGAPSMGDPQSTWREGCWCQGRYRREKIPWSWFLCAATSPRPVSGHLGDVSCPDIGSQEGAGGDPSGSSESAGPSCSAGLDF